MRPSPPSSAGTSPRSRCSAARSVARAPPRARRTHGAHEPAGPSTQQIQLPQGTATEGVLDGLQDAALLEVNLLMALSAVIAWTVTQAYLWATGMPNMSTETSWGNWAVFVGILNIAYAVSALGTLAQRLHGPVPRAHMPACT